MKIILLSALATAIFGLDAHDRRIEGKIKPLKTRSSSIHVCSHPVFSSQEELVSCQQGEEDCETRQNSESSEKSSGGDPVLRVLSEYETAAYSREKELPHKKKTQEVRVHQRRLPEDDEMNRTNVILLDYLGGEPRVRC